MDYTQTLKDLQDYFVSLIIIQYRNAPQNQALIKKLTDLVFANNLALQIKDLTVNVDESIGAQLDVVGKWVGLDRYYNGIDLWTHPYTALVNYNNISSGDYEAYQGGFSTFEDFDSHDGGFLTWEAYQETRTKVNAMGDEYFRSLIKLKILKNNINHTCKNIDEAIWKWSNGDIYTTWQPMEVTYHYPSSYHNLMQLAIYKNVLLAPTGCAIQTEEI